MCLDSMTPLSDLDVLRMYPAEGRINLRAERARTGETLWQIHNRWRRACIGETMVYWNPWPHWRQGPPYAGDWRWDMRHAFGPIDAAYRARLRASSG